MKIHWMWIAFTSALVTIILARIEHCLRRKKRHDRICTCGGSTTRAYQMVPFREKSVENRIGETFLGFVWRHLGQYYEPHTFKVCEGHRVALVRRDYKWFPFFEIWWRQLWDPKQFKIDPSLFIRAGLTGDALPFHVRMLINNEKSQAHARILERRIERNVMR